MQQTWEGQQASSYASTMQPASLPSHAWDAWQSDGQDTQAHNVAELYNIYPPGTYNANQNQPAGSYYSAPGTPQEPWHTDSAHGTGATAYNAAAAAAYNPEQAPHAAVVSSEGCTQTAPYASFGYPTAYQQEPWHTASYASADGTTPEPNLYYAGAPYPNGDHPYLDPAEQQRQIEHAQYLISRWGASDDSTPAADSPCPVTNSGAHSTTFPAPYHVDQLWPVPGEGTPSATCLWGGFGTRQQQWPYNPAQARASVREHGGQTQTPPPAAAAAAAAAAGATMASSAERRQQSWTPKEFQPDDQEQRSMELSASAAAAAAM